MPCLIFFYLYCGSFYKLLADFSSLACCLFTCCMALFSQHVATLALELMNHIEITTATLMIKMYQHEGG